MADFSQPKFFGRRKGRTIHKTKSVLLAQFLPKISLTADHHFNREALFGVSVDKVCLEIGFGDGQHLAALAQRYPKTGFIGLEVFQNGIAHLLTLLTGVKDGTNLPEEINLAEDRTDNVRVFADDARLLLPQIPDGFIDKVYLLFPDPWPKKKHASRRFVNPDNLRELARILRKDGILQIATDHKVYKSWVLRTMKDCPNFEWTARCSDDWRQPPADWAETKYQQKAIREGRRPVFFEYRRL